MQATTTRPKITATADGEGVVSHAGSRLLADVADRTTLTGQLSEALAGLRKPRARHDPGRVLVDMAVAVADGATTISDVAVLADQAALFGPVASDSTCWRLLDRLDTARLGAVAPARAAAREVVVGAARRAVGRAVPAGAGGRTRAAGAGDRPGRLDRGLPQREGTGRADVQEDVRVPPDAGVLRQHRRVPGRAAAARERGQQHRRRPHHRPGRRARRSCPTSTATAPRSWSGPTPPAARGSSWPTSAAAVIEAVSCEFSVGWAITAKERAAITAIPAWLWADAVDADGGHRDGAGLAEITRVLPARVAGRLPGGDPGDRAPGTPAPRRAARRVRRSRRLALHRVRHRHPRRAARPPGRPPPRARPGRGPDPLRERHRPGPLPVPHRSRSTKPG